MGRIFQSLDISFGKHSMKGTLDKDINRIIKMNKKTQEVNKNIRKKKSAIRKGYIDRNMNRRVGNHTSRETF